MFDPRPCGSLSAITIYHYEAISAFIAGVPLALALLSWKRPESLQVKTEEAYALTFMTWGLTGRVLEEELLDKK
jgi:hypothetical protein